MTYVLDKKTRTYKQEVRGNLEILQLEDLLCRQLIDSEIPFTELVVSAEYNRDIRESQVSVTLVQEDANSNPPTIQFTHKVVNQQVTPEKRLRGTVAEMIAKMLMKAILPKLSGEESPDLGSESDESVAPTSPLREFSALNSKPPERLNKKITTDDVKSVFNEGPNDLYKCLIDWRTPSTVVNSFDELREAIENTIAEIQGSSKQCQP